MMTILIGLGCNEQCIVIRSCKSKGCSNNSILCNIHQITREAAFLLLVDPQDCFCYTQDQAAALEQLAAASLKSKKDASDTNA